MQGSREDSKQLVWPVQTVNQTMYMVFKPARRLSLFLELSDGLLRALVGLFPAVLLAFQMIGSLTSMA